MKKFGFLKDDEENEISRAISDFESLTGVELSIVISKEKAPYPAASLRFGILSTFFLALIFTLPYQVNEGSIFVIAMFILLVLFTFIGRFNLIKKSFLLKDETLSETNKRANFYFFNFIKKKTSHERNILLYISLFEKNVDLLLDSEIKNKLNGVNHEILEMNLSKHFNEKNFTSGLLEMVSNLKEELSGYSFNFEESIGNEIEDEIIWIK